VHVWSDLDRPPLRVESLRRGLLAPGGDYAALDVIDETGSTNTDLAAAARTGAPDRTVLVAEHQSAGRGRATRVWRSPPRAGLSLSVLLRAAGVPNSRWGWLPLLTGVALVDAVRAVAEVDAVLKWPNDLLVGPARGKCAGILAEVVGGNGTEGAAVVVGIGLNVTVKEDELPADVGATSLAIENAACTDRDTLLRAVLRELSTVERRWREHGGDPGASGLRDAYRDRCATLGRRVRVDLPAGAPVVGEAVDVDRDGRLVVRDDGGSEHSVSAGTVVHVRPDASPAA
jgi:BirA family transcriptional regulator, biotin operon repressor / biotin---[acetyl-CoA-carboxylase] ligase